MMKIMITMIISFLIASGCNSQNNESKTTYVSDTLKCPEISYSYYFRSPHEINSYYDFDEGLECSKVSRKPYLVYFTGHLSIDARQMEAEVLSNKEILNSIKNEFVITILYVDSRLILKTEKQIISKTNGDTIKKYGLKQAYIENTKFNDKKYPAFFIMDSNGQILSGPIYFELDKNTFFEFLETGKKKYNEQNNK